MGFDSVDLSVIARDRVIHQAFVKFWVMAEGPQGDSRAIKDSVLSVGVSLWFATLEPELTDCPPFSVGFWHNPYCHMNYLDYL